MVEAIRALTGVASIDDGLRRAYCIVFCLVGRLQQRRKGLHGVCFELPTFPELVVVDSVGLSSEGEGISEASILAIFIFAFCVILTLFSLNYAQIAHH